MPIPPIIGALPYTLTNGTTADATQVMADFNTIVNGNGAGTGVNGLALSAQFLAPFSAAGGGADALTVSPTPAVTSPTVDGTTVGIRVGSVANTTTTPTLNVNGIGAFTITKNGGAALDVGDLLPNEEFLARWNLANTRWELVGYIQHASATPGFVTKDLLSGLVCSYASSTTITVASGIANDDTGTLQAPNIQLNAATTKAVFGAFAPGTGNGASDGSVSTTGWNYLFLIGGPGQTTDVLSSASGAAPTLPSPFTTQRRIGAFYAVSSAVRQFVQRGEYWYFTTTPLQSTQTPTLSANAQTNGVLQAALTFTPPGFIGLFSIRAESTGTAEAGVVFQDSDVSTQPTFNSLSFGFDFLISSAFGTLPNGNYIERRVDSSSNLHFAAYNNDSSSGLFFTFITTHGWKDNRGVW